MNILLVPSSYAPNIGGVEDMTRGLARVIRTRGSNVMIVTGRWPASLPERDEVDNIQVRRLDFALPGRHPRNIEKFARSFGTTVKHLAEIVRDHQIDVIHVHCLGPNTLYAVWVAKLLNKPLILTTHGEFQGDDTSMRRSFFMKFIHHWAIRRADCVTACSDFTLRHIPYAYNAVSRVVYNAVTVVPGQQIDVNIRPPFLFCAARLTYNKGVDVALRAYEAVSAVHPAIEFWIAGDGAERAALEALAKELGVSERVKFLGKLKPKEVSTLMARCLAYVCPSRNEGFGLVNLEAMACAKPVIASRVGGVPEVVLDGQTGLLVPPENPPALAAAIRSLLDCPDRAAELGRAGRARVAAEFTWPRIADQYFEIYHAVLPAQGAIS